MDSQGSGFSPSDWSESYRPSSAEFFALTAARQLQEGYTAGQKPGRYRKVEFETFEMLLCKLQNLAKGFQKIQPLEVDNDSQTRHVTKKNMPEIATEISEINTIKTRNKNKLKQKIER
eukprot:TRINITY_DN200109_c0_g1_i1.p2 TRINITY_DN200109_c0_g1~~TRINITY_DN200109_c0_g1_i1.p2  ORF type:complete len:118 (-),score=7.40 TRINITY_DN200109_c0_g1_i1:91-444(-)